MAHAPEEVRDALKARLKANPSVVKTAIPRAGYNVEGMNVERRIHADQSRKLRTLIPVMCKNCAHMKEEEDDLYDPESDTVRLFNAATCSKPMLTTCPDGFNATSDKWKVPWLTADFVEVDDPMLFQDHTRMIETPWPTTDAARAAGFMEYTSPDELRVLSDKSAAYKGRGRTQSSTPKTIDGDVW